MHRFSHLEISSDLLNMILFPLDTICIPTSELGRWVRITVNSVEKYRSSWADQISKEVKGPLIVGLSTSPQGCVFFFGWKHHSGCDPLIWRLGHYFNELASRPPFIAGKEISLFINSKELLGLGAGISRSILQFHCWQSY